MWAAALISICILSFTLFKGCQKSEADDKIKAQLNDSLSNLAKEREADHLAAIKSKQDYQNSLAVNSGLLELKDNQLAATSVQLNIANAKILDLLQRHTPIAPSDSGTTTVPSEYIEECAECFAHLERQTGLVQRYQQEVSEKDKIQEVNSENYEKRIAELESEKAKSDKSANDYKDVAKAAMKSAQFRRTFYFTLAFCAKEGYLPNGVGTGLMYQDKKRRIYGITVFGTNQGTMATGNLTLPLTFRKP